MHPPSKAETEWCGRAQQVSMIRVTTRGARSAHRHYLKTNVHLLSEYDLILLEISLFKALIFGFIITSMKFQICLDIANLKLSSDINTLS